MLKLRQSVQKTPKINLYAVYRGILSSTGEEVERRRASHVGRSGHFGDEGPPLRPGSRAVSPTWKARESPPPQLA